MDDSPAAPIPVSQTPVREPDAFDALLEHYVACHHDRNLTAGTAVRYQRTLQRVHRDPLAPVWSADALDQWTQDRVAAGLSAATLRYERAVIRNFYELLTNRSHDWMNRFVAEYRIAPTQPFRNALTHPLKNELTASERAGTKPSGQGLG